MTDNKPDSVEGNLYQIDIGRVTNVTKEDNICQGQWDTPFDFCDEGKSFGVCHSINGPSVFCVDTSIKDGRDGPFMLYNNGSVLEQSGTLKAVYRCYSNTTGVHWLSSDSVCNERTGGHMESILGWAAGSRGGGTLRELFRCEGKIFFSHALDIGCLHNTTIATISLGFVR